MKHIIYATYHELNLLHISTPGCYVNRGQAIKGLPQNAVPLIQRGKRKKLRRLQKQRQNLFGL